MNTKTVTKPFPAIYDDNSVILILGTMPSPVSRKNGVYYFGENNRFWRLLADLLGIKEPKRTWDETAKFLKDNHIALFDVLYSCDIQGASDKSIKNPEFNCFDHIFKCAPNIKTVFTVGRSAEKFYKEYYKGLPLDRQKVYPHEDNGDPCIYLPSTSSANPSSDEELKESWQKLILPKLFPDRYL